MVRAAEIPLRVCRKCEQPKPPAAFSADRAKPDGLRRDCKDCQAERLKAWRHATGRSTPSSRWDAEGRARCFQCREYKPRSEYSTTGKPGKAGVPARCRACNRKHLRTWHATRPQEDRARAESVRRVQRRRPERLERELEARRARWWAARGVPTVGDASELRRPDEALTPEQREERDDLRELWGAISDLWLMRGQMVAYQAHLAAARLEDDAEIVDDARGRAPAQSVAAYERGKRRAA